MLGLILMLVMVRLMLVMTSMMMLVMNLQVMENALSRSVVNFARGGSRVESATRKFCVSRCLWVSEG